ncbi:hypothetical protein CTH30272_04329 [Allocatenococcus thiocycli]|nr:hypothetical protein CTH30272_04329 [Catenococcus thiocycli]
MTGDVAFSASFHLVFICCEKVMGMWIHYIKATFCNHYRVL